MAVSSRVNFEKFRQKYEQTRDYVESLGKSGESIKWKFGDNIIRICPPPIGDDMMFRELRFHHNVGGNSNNHPLCPLEERGHCVVCEEITRLRNTEDPEDLRIAKEWSRKRTFLWNVIDVNELTAQLSEKGATFQTVALKVKQIYAGVMIQDQIMGIMHNERMPEIDDPERGADVCVKKTKTGSEAVNVSYNVFAFPPAAVTPEVAEVMNAAPPFKSLLWYFSDEEMSRMLTGEEVRRGQANGTKETTRQETAPENSGRKARRKAGKSSGEDTEQSSPTSIWPK